MKKTLALTLAFFAFFIITAPTAHAAFLDGLVNYWDGDGANESVDRAGGDSPMTKVGIPAYTTNGKIGNGFVENSSSTSYFTSANTNAPVGISANVTLCYWFNPSLLSGYHHIINYGANEEDSAFGTYIDASGSPELAVFYGRNNDQPFTGTDLDVGTFSFICQAYDNTNNELMLYFDGNNTNNATKDLSLGGGVVDRTLRLGVDTGVLNSNLGAGVMDEIGIWNRVLSQAEVTSLYNGGSGLAYPFGETPPDTTPPVITSATASTITEDSATITWTTDEDANSSVNYGLTTSLGTINDNAALTQAHSIGVASLTSNTTYYYNVTSCDASDNCATDGPYSFNTLETVTPPGTTPSNIQEASDRAITVFTTLGILLIFMIFVAGGLMKFAGEDVTDLFKKALFFLAAALVIGLILILL